MKYLHGTISGCGDGRPLRRDGSRIRFEESAPVVSGSSLCSISGEAPAP